MRFERDRNVLQYQSTVFFTEDVYHFHAVFKSKRAGSYRQYEVLMSWSVISRPIGSVEKIGIAPAHFSRGMVGVEILKANNRSQMAHLPRRTPRRPRGGLFPQNTL